jgi:Ni/Co efflux regulator RcnB
MKKIALAIAGASVALGGLAATPASAADFGHQNRGRHAQVQTRKVVRNRIVVNNRYQQNHRWQRGQRFDQRYVTNYRVISNPYAYHLRQAPRGYRWVRSGNDAILVAITTGIISSILANQF